MDVMEAAKARRSIRSYREAPVSRQVLTEMVEAARLAPVAVNRQCLEFVVVDEPGLAALIFATLKWAALTAPKGTPAPGHRPTAYLAVCVRQEYKPAIGAAYDIGAAIQSILLLAVARGLGGCWLKSINIPQASQILGLPEGVELDSIVALGPADEAPAVVELAPDQSGLEVVKYYRDEANQHFVPKRALAAVVSWQKYGGKLA
ncbi:MAG: nitroreductase family protein [Deltaproteobacteria bacterium]|nr:nitroreductase family protein [Deltaproteobacteria bacterium]